MRKVKTKPDHVVRISHENFTKLKDMCGITTPRMTINQIMDRMLSALETLDAGDAVYLLHDGKYTMDLAEARGFAITWSIAKKRLIEWPYTAIIVGQDDGT